MGSVELREQEKNGERLLGQALAEKDPLSARLLSTKLELHCFHRLEKAIRAAGKGTEILQSVTDLWLQMERK